MPSSAVLIYFVSISTRCGENWSTVAPPIKIKIARGTPIRANTRPSASGSLVMLNTSKGKATMVNWSPTMVMTDPAHSQRKFRFDMMDGFLALSGGAVATASWVLMLTMSP